MIRSGPECISREQATASGVSPRHRQAVRSLRAPRPDRPNERDERARGQRPEVAGVERSWRIRRPEPHLARTEQIRPEWYVRDRTPSRIMRQWSGTGYDPPVERDAAGRERDGIAGRRQYHFADRFRPSRALPCPDVASHPRPAGRGRRETPDGDRPLERLGSQDVAVQPPGETRAVLDAEARGGDQQRRSGECREYDRKASEIALIDVPCRTSPGLEPARTPMPRHPPRSHRHDHAGADAWRRSDGACAGVHIGFTSASPSKSGSAR